MDDATRFWQQVEKYHHASVQSEREAARKELWAEFGARHAIVFTDLSGFTRLSVAHGIESFLGVIRASQRIFEPLIAEHGGRILKFEGDSLMAIFEDAGRALTSIDALYLAADAYNVERAMQEEIRLCVGVGYGDVLVAGEHDIFGLEVNWASLLGEDTAQAGEVLLTEAAVEALRSTAFINRCTLRSDGSTEHRYWCFEPTRREDSQNGVD